MEWLKEGKKETLTKEIGPGVACKLTETEDKMGFEIRMEGSFRSGNDIKKTMEDIEKAWGKIDIDAS